ncbi:Integrase, catalytic core, phage domain protein [Candidatus Magnetobacterium bavaricum]|uniref:Integrase, catalytic core, phage domain protein n=1 Tax=Candidatus Magnetobacterium bavaricum TaxID=29290 RepID=A0A0F3H0K4_9BACT|nr:Integrase, catalytic core, phage domain protein [Candidatus Magnetobacterium bavaricum]
MVVEFRVHDLRHTFASLLVQKGASLQTVQELLGHTSYNTTLIYAHLSQRHLQDAIAKIRLLKCRNTSKMHPPHLRIGIK